MGQITKEKDESWSSGGGSGVTMEMYLQRNK